MAWSVLLYVFTALGGTLFIYFIISKIKKPKRELSSPSGRCDTVRKTLPLGSRSGWELISMEHGLRLWKRNRSDGGLLFATSAILPVSLEILVKILSDPLMILEWDPWIKSVSLISMSKAEESSSRFSGDVISVMEELNCSSWISETINILASLFKSDEKLYSRTWHHEKDIQFWLHSSVVEPHSTDPVYLMFLAFPLKGTSDMSCEVNILCDVTSSFNPCSLTAKLSGLKDYIVRSQSEVVYPENTNKDQAKDFGVEEFEDITDDISSKDPEEKEMFVDITGVYLKPENDVQRYKTAIDGALKKAMECYHAKDGEDGWAFVGNVKNIEILKKSARPGFSIWDCSKGTGEINVPLHYLIAYCRNLEHTADYDDMFHAGHLIEDLGDLTNIAYLEYKAIWPVSGRDFCAFNAIRVLSDDTYVMAARSIKHPACPKNKKYVRGQILIGGFIMKVISEDPPRIMLTYITHVDLAGSVPSSIVNKITANQPQSVAILKHHVEKYYREELANPEQAQTSFMTKAMDILEKLETAKTMLQSSKPAETNPLGGEPAKAIQETATANGDVVRDGEEEEVLTPHIQSSTSDANFQFPSTSVSPFDNVNIDYRTIGNQASAGLLQEVFEVAEVDITKIAGSTGTVNEQWEYRGTEKEVMMFRKVHAIEKMHSFIGKGIIPCSPSKVWDTLKTPGTRYHYDNMLKETKILNEISESVMIEYLHFETANCFQKQARDFVILRAQRKERDKYLIAATSIDYPNTPRKRDVRRGMILASGWVIEPLLRNGELCSMVTYLSQINPGGNYPVNLINLVSRKQPLCISYLRKYLENPTYTTNDSSP